MIMRAFIFLSFFFLASCDKVSVSPETGGALSIYVVSASEDVDVGSTANFEVTVTENGQPVNGIQYTWSDESGNVNLASSDNKAHFIAPAGEDQAIIRVLAEVHGLSTSRTFLVNINDPNASITGSIDQLDISGPSEVLGGHQVILNASYTVNGVVDQGKVLEWSQFDGPAVTLTPADASGMRVGFTVPDVTQDTDFTFAVQTEGVDGTLFLTIWLMTAKPDGIAFENLTSSGKVQVGSGSQSPDMVKQVTSGHTVHLTAKASAASGGGISYNWQQVGGTSVTLTGATAQAATFIAPSTTEKLAFKVTATDSNTGKSTSQIQEVQVNGQAFQPQQGVQHHVYNGHGPITLTAPIVGGTAPFTYAWKQIAGPHAQITSTTTATVDVTPPSVSTDTQFEWTVGVTDANGKTVVITHAVKVLATAALSVNIIKPAGCQLACLVEEGDRVHPAANASGGTGSYSYTWSSAAVTLLDPNTENPSFDVPNVNSETQISLSVQVSDGVNTASDTLVYTAKPVLKLVAHQNQVNANAGTGTSTNTSSGTQVEAGKLYKPSIDIHVPPLTGGASLSYAWSVISPQPVPGDLIIAGANTAQPLVTSPSVATNTQVQLQAVITYTSATGKIIQKTGQSLFTAVPQNAPSKPPMDISMAGHVSVYSGHVVNPKVTVVNAASTPSHQWTQKSGPTVTLKDANTDSPSFTAPSVSGHQDIVIEVEVSDGSTVKTAQMTVSVDPVIAPPKLPLSVTASVDASVVANSSVTPRASVTNAFGSLSYAWAQTAGSPVTLANANTATPSFTAPATAGTVTLEVTVTDASGGSSATDTVVYTVQSALLVTAGAADRTLAEGNTVDLLASVKDANGAVTYAWTITDDGGTGISTGDITNANTANASLALPNVNGDSNVKIQVTATDTTPNTSTAMITVHIQDRHLRVDVGADYTMPPSQIEYLHANVQGGLPPYTYTWTDDANAPLSSTSDANPNFMSPANNVTLNYSVSAVDSLGNTANDAVVITTLVPPFGVDGGVDAIALENSAVQLFAHTENGTASTWAWTQKSGTSVSLNNDTTQSPDFTAPNVSAGTIEELVFEVVATPAAGAAAKDQVKVLVQSLPDITVHTNNITVASGQPVKLVGTVLNRDDTSPGTVTSLQWSQSTSTQSASVGALSNASATGNQRELTTTFVAPTVTTSTDFAFMFTAKGTGNIVQQPMTVTVLPNPPTVEAGPSINAQSGVKVQLSAASSNQSATSYSWSQTAGTSVSLTDANTATPSFTAPAVSVCDAPQVFPTPCVALTFEVTATNSGGASTDSVTVNIIKPKILIQTSNAKSLVVNEGDSVDLPISFTLTNGGVLAENQVDIQWTYAGGAPGNSGVSFANAMTATPTITASEAGIYTISVLAKAKTDTDTLDNGALSFTLTIKAPSLPPLMSDKELNNRLVAANADMTALSGTETTVSLHVPAITGGQPPYSYQWVAPTGLTVNGDSTSNAEVVIPAPTSACTFIEGDITLTVKDSAGQSVASTLHYKNTRDADAIPTQPTTCTVCRGPKFICERAHQTRVCGGQNVGGSNPLNLSPDQVYQYQYCVNDVENLTDGSRYVLRRCATADDVKVVIKDLDRPECKNYNVKALSDTHFSCSYACKGADGQNGRGCNLDTVPPNRIDKVVSPPPASTPGACPNGIVPQSP